MKSDTKKWLTDLSGPNAQFDEPMSRHTSFRVGGPADAYVTPETGAELSGLITGARERGLRYFIIGSGTNLLVKDKGFRGIVVSLRKYFNKITLGDNTLDRSVIVTAMAGARLGRLCGLAIKQGLEGMNFAIGIPGTVGGAVIMNAGTARGATENVLVSVEILLPDGQIRTFTREELNFEYRRMEVRGEGSEVRGQATDNRQQTTDNRQQTTDNRQFVILGAQFLLHPSDPFKLKQEAAKFFKARKKSQPVGMPNAGCFFKNPWKSGSRESAGRLIDLAGLKGTRIHGAQVSEKHANFIVNKGNASAGNILDLVRLVQDRVSEKFDISLEPEVRIIGE